MQKVSSQVAKAEERWYSPVVIQLARGANIPKEELDSIQGTGYEGRLSKKDIKDYIEKKKRNFRSLEGGDTYGDALTASMPSSTGGAGSMTTLLWRLPCKLLLLHRLLHLNKHLQLLIFRE